MSTTRRVLHGACLVAVLAWSHAAPAASDDERGFDIGWLLFGDLYYVPGFHNEEGDDAAGLVLRRGYLTFDADLSANWFGRLRFEANQSGEFENYDFEIDPKDLYLGRDIGAHELLAGLSPTLTYDLIEDWWGLRYLARTPMDLQGVPSRDTGLALRGPLSADGRLSYRLMYGSDVEFGADSGAGHKVMAAVSWQSGTRWLVDLYADRENLPGPSDRRTLQGFVGYRTDAVRWGLQYSHQDRSDDPPLELASGFLVARAGSRSSLILRVDRLLEPSPKGDDISYLPFDPSARATMLIAGVEVRASEHLAITPNIVTKHYDRNDAGEQPDDDVHLRLTVFLDFD